MIRLWPFWPRCMSSRPFCETDSRFYRPAEVNVLIGDASKARDKLGWSPTVSFEELVHMMVDADLSVLQDARQSDLFQQMHLQVGLSTLTNFGSRCTETALELLITQADLAMKAGKAAGETICHFDDLDRADADSTTHSLQNP